MMVVVVVEFVVVVEVVVVVVEVVVLVAAVVVEAAAVVVVKDVMPAQSLVVFFQDMIDQEYLDVYALVSSVSSWFPSLQSWIVSQLLVVL